MVIRNELFEFIKNKLPIGMHKEDEITENIKNEFLSDYNEMECAVYFSGHVNPIRSLDNFRPLQESYRVQLLINSGSSKELLTKTKEWSEEARLNLMLVHNDVRYKLDDSATEEMRNISIPENLEQNAISYLRNELAELEYVGSFEYVYIDRIEPLGNIVRLDRNEQGITRYSINFIIYYTYNKEV